MIILYVICILFLILHWIFGYYFFKICFEIIKIKKDQINSIKIIQWQFVNLNTNIWTLEKTIRKVIYLKNEENKELKKDEFYLHKRTAWKDLLNSVINW